MRSCHGTDDFVAAPRVGLACSEPGCGCARRGAPMTPEFLHKTAQLLVVIGGFYTGLALLPWNSWEDSQQTVRLAATALFIFGLTVRYWWVILLLDWPFRIFRVVL